MSTNPADANKSINVSLSNIRRPMAWATGAVAYRIVQESLTNVIRHAQASSVSVLLTRDAGQIRLVIEDDGVGFDAVSASAHGGGLQGMADRVGAVGGALTVATAPGRGTRAGDS